MFGGLSKNYQLKGNYYQLDLILEVCWHTKIVQYRERNLLTGVVQDLYVSLYLAFCDFFVGT